MTTENCEDPTDFNPADYADEDMGDTFLDIDTSGAIEPTVADEGEHLIRITGFKKDKESGKVVRTSDSGMRYFLVTFDLPNDLAAKSFTQIYSLPTDSMEPKRKNSCLWELDCFKRCFALTELNFSTMVGAEGYAILGIKEDSYGRQNYIKKLVTPA